jgi:8-hydroxy-5-deazaflavin:NADPH oxidoreductase
LSRDTEKDLFWDAQFWCAQNASMLFQKFLIDLLLVTMASLSSKTVAIVGGGSVGSTLANAIDKSGKAGTVVIAARHPEKTKQKLAETNMKHLKVEDAATAIAAADILILAVPSVHTDGGIQEMAKSLGDVSGKTIIDATNPLSEFQDGLQVRWPQGTSGGEVLQNLLPDSKVYKAFNTLGVEHMANAQGKDMLFAGPDDSIADVIAAVGYKPFYVGPIRYARNLEAIAELWIHCAIPPLPAQYHGRDWTFSIAGNPE